MSMGVAAIVVSVVALAIGVSNWVRARRQDERDLFLKIHERLLDPELMAARDILYGLGSVSEVEALPREDRTRLYQLFAMYDVLALYVEEGWISRETVLDEWGHSLWRSVAPGSHFIAYRRRITDTTWPHYMALAREASSHLGHRGS